MLLLHASLVLVLASSALAESRPACPVRDEVGPYTMMGGSALRYLVQSRLQGLPDSVLKYEAILTQSCQAEALKALKGKVSKRELESLAFLSRLWGVSIVAPQEEGFLAGKPADITEKVPLITDEDLQRITGRNPNDHLFLAVTKLGRLMQLTPPNVSSQGPEKISEFGSGNALENFSASVTIRTFESAFAISQYGHSMEADPEIYGELKSMHNAAVSALDGLVLEHKSWLLGHESKPLHIADMLIK